MPRSLRLAAASLAASLVIALSTPLLLVAQTAPKPAADATAPKVDRNRLDANDYPERTLYLKNIVDTNEMNECVTALRNALPNYVKIFLVPSQGTIVLRAAPEETDLAAKILSDLDRPQKVYRLNYTFTEIDGDKRLGSQHFSTVAVAGQQVMLKQGNRIPIVTALSSAQNTSGSSQSQLQYQDVGIYLSATLSYFNDGARLRFDVVQSGLADEKSSVGIADPVFRQSELKGEAILTSGRPLVLGSMDVPGSTRRLEVEVVMQPIP